jgi:hypothetical protein
MLNSNFESADGSARICLINYDQCLSQVYQPRQPMLNGITQPY